MFRKLIFSRWLISGDSQEKISFLNKLKRHPVLLACLSSGLLYRGYVTLPQQGIYRTQKPTCFCTLPNPGHFTLFSEGQTAGGTPSSTAKAERLASLKRAVEEELPQFFERSIFELPSTLVDPATVLHIERKNGSIVRIRNQTCLLVSVTVSRLYYYSCSFYRRVELLNILSDVDKGQLEVNFRIVLLPSPSLRDSRLPKENLMQKLEERAKWHEFRVIFNVSEAGEVHTIHLTKFMPPQKPTATLKNLKQLAMLNRLSPSLPTSRRLPSPVPYLSFEQTTEQMFSLPSCSTSEPEVSTTLALVRELAGRHTLTSFDQLMHEYAKSAKRWHSLSSSRQIKSHTIGHLSESDVSFLSALMVVPSNSVSHFLLPTLISPNLTPLPSQPSRSPPNGDSNFYQSGTRSENSQPVQYSVQTASDQHTDSVADDDDDDDDNGEPFLPRLMREWPHSTILRQAFNSASNSFCHSV